MSTVYRALDTERREIRLLALHPAASFDAAIQCSLSYAFLDSTPAYEALSYVWGPLEHAREALVEGQSTKITENLDCALRYLRQASADRILWVDALCINQVDILERNHQVTLMKEIYSQCTCDLAWLGPNPGTGRAASRFDPSSGLPQGDDDQGDGEQVVDPEYENVLEGMRIFRNISQRDAVTLDKMVVRWQNIHDDPEYRPGLLLSPEERIALFELFAWSPLWSRMWVVQELSCAQRVRLIAGTESLDWDDVASFLDDDNKPYADAFHVVGGHSTVYGIMVNLFGRVKTIQQQRRIMKDIQAGKYDSKLIDVLARFQYANAMDPRDLIYGLLGLVSEQHPIKVDYRMPVEALYMDVTRFFINQTANLDIICQSPWSTNAVTGEGLNLPSWVVDFANKQRFAHFEDTLESLLFAQRGIFSAGPPSCSVPCKVSADGLLEVDAVIVDEVRPIPEENTEDSLGAWTEKGMELYLDRKQLTGEDASIYMPTGEPVFRAFWRTLVMDCKSYPIVRLSQKDIEADEAIVAKIVHLERTETNNTDPPPYICPFDLESVWMLKRSYSHWKFAMSKTGLFLMVGKNAQAGDVIVVLDGGKVPCLLRRQDSHTSRYRVISAVYVHGYMDGKVATNVEKGLLQRREILLA